MQCRGGKWVIGLPVAAYRFRFVYSSNNAIPTVAYTWLESAVASEEKWF
jgi:hypothetical protein